MANSAKPPRAIAIIPDGQRRWARASGASFRTAYEAGAENTRLHLAAAKAAGIELFAVWGGSIENLRERPAEEILVLHQVYERFLREVLEKWMHEPVHADMRFVYMGQIETLNKTERALIEKITTATADRTGMVVALCLGYSGLDEQARALAAWRAEGERGDWTDYLDLPRQGIAYRPFDLIIRTGEGDSGIVHDNEYLHAYRRETRLRFRTEFYPDYTPAMLGEDLAAFGGTKQRRGA